MKYLSRIKSRFFPSNLELTARRWVDDGGDEKFRFNYDLNEKSTVVDLGGYEGQWASDIYSRFNCYVIIFEPVQSYARKIEARFANNKKITLYPYALGECDKEIEISILGTRSSVYLNGRNKEKISVVDVVSWFEQADLCKVDVMKINIEGAEYELIFRLIETKIVERIENIQVQFHLIDANSKNLMHAIQDRLRETHKLTFCYEFVWENWKKLK